MVVQIAVGWQLLLNGKRMTDRKQKVAFDQRTSKGETKAEEKHICPTDDDAL